MNKEDYERDLKKRQEEHLKRIQERPGTAWKPCAHDSCTSCLGTGRKADGSPCVHMLYCNCPKCTPSYDSPTKYNVT